MEEGIAIPTAETKVSPVPQKKKEEIPVIQGLPVPNFNLIDDTNKGTFSVIFEKPNLSNPIYIDKGGFVDRDRTSATYGKVIQYKNPFNQEPEDIVITTSGFSLDLRTPEGKAKADFLRKFNIQKTLGTKATITDSHAAASSMVSGKDREYELVALVRPFLTDSSKLQALALNLGNIEVKGVAATDIKKEIYRLIQTEPDRVEKTINDPDFDIRATIIYAAKMKVVNDTTGSYYYGQLYMGANVDQAIKWARANANEYQSIVKELP
jgi:hypothetical protein